MRGHPRPQFNLHLGEMQTPLNSETTRGTQANTASLACAVCYSTLTNSFSWTEHGSQIVSLELGRRAWRHRTRSFAGARRLGAERGKPELNGGLHHRARAKRVIQLFMSGAASQCDTFDYKPLLIRKAGEKWDPGEKVDCFRATPVLLCRVPGGGSSMGSPVNGSATCSRILLPASMT